MFTFSFLGLVVGGVVGWFAHEWWNRIIVENTIAQDTNDKFKGNPCFKGHDGKKCKRVGDKTSNIYRDEDGNEYELGKDRILRPRYNLNYR